MPEFLELAKAVGLPVAILVAVLWVMLKRWDRQMEQDRQERQRAWDAHQTAIETMTASHSAAMKDMSASVAQMANAVTANTEQVRNCRAKQP